MTQKKDKDLLFKDLCARLPYGVKVEVKYYDNVWNIFSIICSVLFSSQYMRKALSN